MGCLDEIGVERGEPGLEGGERGAGARWVVGGDGGHGADGSTVVA